ncbi:shikimate dehydrogenase [Aliidiomarina indica]|uniref:shikimate dehydrogenase n=1 Tax=Aliidiomarina indica TaxID=2749147 RepID=UPI00188DE5D6|nr:shikimate dehydrogenase [Aliidiomarina indica]
MSEYKFTVFGSPIAHSRSPDIHQCFAREFGLRIEYTRSLASPTDFPEQFRAFAAAGGQGANVTLPLKELALTLVATVSPRAQFAGAVNTLVKTESGWHGENTDGAGLLLDLERLGAPLAGARVLLVGAGGAARGVVGPLLSAQIAQLTIANRSIAKAEAIVTQWQQRKPDGETQKIVAMELSAPTLNQPWDLIINATSAGLADERPELSEHVLNSKPFCYDMVYGTKPTAFMQWAQSRSCFVADGFGMLVGQAAESFRLWTGQRPNIERALTELR